VVKNLGSKREQVAHDTGHHDLQFGEKVELLTDLQQIKITLVKINRKEKTAALFATLSQKVKLGKVIFSDMIAMDTAKTKEAEKMLKNFATIAGFETLNTDKKNNHLA
jgi:hypothetical protein